MIRKIFWPLTFMINYPQIGWRERVSLPRTSALHAFAIKTLTVDSKTIIQFDIHPFQHDTHTIVTCEAEVIDKRWITDSGGHKEERYVIATPVKIGDQTWPIEITLTERDTMLFRMLLGRSAIRNRYIVHPGRSFITTKKVKVS
jgi:hypothetical protein